MAHPISDTPLKPYHQAPLPFIGQKRFFIRKFRDVINAKIQGDGEGWTIVDVFGGSGLLAHNAKQLKPSARVIYNDFDDYSQRLKHIDDINAMRQLLFAIMQQHGIKRQQKVDDDIKQQIVELLKNHQGYLDVNTLATWLLFSGKQIKTLDELYANSFYHCVRTSDYPKADHYLDGIEVVHECFTKLIPQFDNDDKVLLLLDPPYLNTDQNSYKQEKYFALVDFLKLMDLVRPPFIFFSSTKSEILEYFDYMQELDGEQWSRIGGYDKIAVKSQLNHNVKYEDNMIYKL